MKNKKLIIPIVLAVLLVWGVICGFILKRVLFDSNQDVDTDYEKRFQELWLTEEQEKMSTDLINELEENRKDKKFAKEKKTIDKLENLYKECEMDNFKRLDEMETEIDSYNYDNILPVQSQLLGQYKNAAEEFKNEKNYRQAIMQYEYCISDYGKFQFDKGYEFNIEQIDVSNYPNVGLYVSAYDAQNDVHIAIMKEYLELKLLNEGVYADVEIKQVNKLDKHEKLNTCLVADISGSMYEEIGILKAAMKNFVGYMQYDAGDTAALISFDDNVYMDAEFTNNVGTISSAIDDLYVGNSTALYDALYVAVCKTAATNGAKCVIGFTDGCDNVSSKTVEDVINVANMYEIPVYLVGVGDDIDEITLRDICDRTGGTYRTISNANEMEYIYKEIYTQTKEMYLVEYNAESLPVDHLQNIYLSYFDESIYMGCETEFRPSDLQKEVKDYEEIIQTSALNGAQIEDEVLRIRALYNNIVSKQSNNQYKVSKPYSGVTTYTENGDTYCVIVAKGVDGNEYTRYYYYENNKLIFAYLESSDSHRLYFHNDSLFRWRYASNAVKYTEAQNHDNEDSNEFRRLEKFALEEGYKYIP